ncbi:MAG TPA: UbiA prenyltransferase family protein [Candidatus Polarisedimenticolia bacterium]|nr:UbiA prenyltransferase family protein [Candidatus Polarisedimenticolia bacterium]
MAASTARKAILYLRLARVDHWFKNIFVLPGIVAAFLLEPGTRRPGAFGSILLGLLATCLVASSNYVLNEILDARTDRFHPTKSNRPLVSRELSITVAYVEWILLALLGAAIGCMLPRTFLAGLAALWLMGLVYNVPPVRSKEVPYLDVLSEAINNPIRFLLGWSSVGAVSFPPSSFLLSYWLIGSYLMTAKRLSEYRSFADPAEAGRYRASFRHYNEALLATAMLTYAAGFMFFFGVLMMKYHIEYLLALPLLLLYVAYYSYLSFQPHSVAQNPEKLYRDAPLMALTVLLAGVLWGLSYLNLPGLAHWLGMGGVGW